MNLKGNMSTIQWGNNISGLLIQTDLQTNYVHIIKKKEILKNKRLHDKKYETHATETEFLSKLLRRYTKTPLIKFS